MNKYYITYASDKYDGEYTLSFNTEKELLDWMRGKEFFTFDVIYGKKISLIPKQTVIDWEISNGQ